MFKPLSIAKWEELMTRFPIDPYLVWSDLTKFRQFQNEKVDLKVLVFLVELKAPYVEGSLGSGSVPALFNQPLSAGICATFVTVRIVVPAGNDVASPLDVLIENEKVCRVQLGFPVTAEKHATSYTPEPADPPEITYDHPCDVIYGLMDDGCAFAHEQVRVAGRPETRVLALWDQTPIDPGDPEKTPGYLPYGTGFVKAQFDKSIASHWLGNEVEEDSVYLEAFSAKRLHGLNGARTHGTAVMDVFAGRLPPRRHPGAPYDQMRVVDSPIVFVQFPLAESTVANGRWLATHVLEGIHYLFAMARKVAGQGVQDDCRKIVMTLSYGALAGPHDGSSMLARALGEASYIRGNLGIVVAAGNSRSARCHASVEVPVGKSATFNITVPPVKPFETYAEVWLDDPEAARVEVLPPAGIQLSANAGQVVAWNRDLRPQAGDEEIAAMLAFPTRAVQGKTGSMALLAMASAETTAGNISARPGKWQVNVVNTGHEKSMRVRIWIERDDLLAVHPQQYAHFDRSDDMQGDNDQKQTPANDYVTTADTLTNVAGGDYLYPVGGYVDVRTTHHLRATRANYSGEGSSTNVPPLYACTDEGFGSPGLRVAGTFTGSYTRMSGTSVAAPQAARALGEAMRRARGSLTADQIRELFLDLRAGRLRKATEVADPPAGQAPLVVLEIAPSR